MENQTSGSKAIRLLQISDLHCYADDNRVLEWSELPVYPNQSLQKLLVHLSIHYQDYHALVISGDIVQEESIACYQRVRELLTDFPLPIYVLPGNHDVPAFIQEHLVDGTHIHSQEQQTWGNWHSLFLDTHLSGHSDGHLDKNKLARLDSQLKTVPEDHHVILFMHHHPVPIGSPWMDGLGLQQGTEFWTVVKSHPQIRSIIFGHIHSEFFTEQASVAVYGTPATCIQASHTGETIGFEHTRPAWRELILHPNGRLETHVGYLQGSSDNSTA